MDSTAFARFPSPDEGGEETLHVVVEYGAGPRADEIVATVAAILNRVAPVRVHFAAIPRNELGKINRSAVMLLTRDRLRTGSQ